MDLLGNWTTLTTDGTGVNRTHNQQNQVTAVGGNTLTFDNNGNTTTDETGRKLVYDAWNRLVEVKDSQDQRIRRYSYDALGRRVTELNGTAKDFYYSAQWQLLEEYTGSGLYAQYVWSPVYVDALVLRDRATGPKACHNLRREAKR